MKHAASRELYAYWEEKRGTRPAPERAEIEPGAIRGVLSDAFILALDRNSGHPVRLAGTRVCALFGREIKGESFLDLWAPSSRPIVDGLVAILSDGVHRHGRRRDGAQTRTATRSTWSFCCCRSARGGQVSRERSVSWPRSKFRNGWAQAQSAH